MRKSQPVVYHGLLKDYTLYDGLTYMYANKKVFLGTPRKVIGVKLVNKAKTLSKVKRPSQRHR